MVTCSLSTQVSPYSAQIDFDMHEFNLFFFIHALGYHHVDNLVSNERRENALDAPRKKETHSKKQI